MLRVARSGALKARTGALNQLRSLVSTAPVGLREQLRDLPIATLVTTTAMLRPASAADTTAVTKRALRSLGRRVQQLEVEIDKLDELLRPLVVKTAPALLACHGVGPETASPLLIAAGDNAGRLRSEAAYARICGVAPIPAGSGKTDGNHRLHRGGDRQANAALWRIVMVRMSSDPRTQAYVERRTKEGLSKKKIIRCLKRYMARELYRYLPQETTA